MKSHGSSSNGIIVFHANDIILGKPLWIKSAGQKKLTEMAYKIINVMKHSLADFQEFKASTVEKIG